MSPLHWIILTRGDRPAELAAAVRSVDAPTTVLVNGDAEVNAPGAEVISTGQNLGIPAGRDWALRQTNSDALGFLDDDAVAGDGIGDLIRRAFAADPTIGAVALRIVDEHQATARRHVPRLGGRRAEIGGPVTLFLGGACAIRRDAYLDAGGYWGELFYGHEEVELAWRLIDRGWRIMYLPDACVFHPRTDIGRHPDGWRLTGRNRVMIARRTLPWTVALAHTTAWLLIGLARAPGRSQRSAYVSGWRQGWRRPVDRSPIAWSTVWRLSRLGRPPVV